MLYKYSNVPFMAVKNSISVVTTLMLFTVAINKDNAKEVYLLVKVLHPLLMLAFCR